MQKQVEGVDIEKKKWMEVVDNLWDKQLSHFRREVYNVYHPHTGRYGFQVGSEYDSEDSLINDLMNEPSVESSRKEDEVAGQPENKGKVDSSLSLTPNTHATQNLVLYVNAGLHLLYYIIILYCWYAYTSTGFANHEFTYP